MLDSYFQEVRNKRRKSLIFWLIVLIFAIFLYLFFNGKYISINVDWGNNSSATISDSWVTLTGSAEKNSFISFHSFWIVNIKVFPKNASIFLNSEPYINDSKPKIDYGKYQLDINANGYLSGSMDFKINEEKNFYINNITLLKKPQYHKFETITDSRIIKISENVWIGYSASWMLLYQNDFLTPKNIHKKSLNSIGDGKFLSGSSVVEYSLIDNTWINEKDPIINNFVKKCSEIFYKNGMYFCKNTSELMTKAGRILKNPKKIWKNFIEFENSILLGDIASGNAKTFSLTGETLSGKTLSENFFEMHGNWFNISENGEIFSMDKNTAKSTEIPLQMKKINFFQEIWDRYFFIGETSTGKTLAITNSHKNFEEFSYLNFPDIELKDVKIYEKNQNFFIKTANALLFFYNESNQIKWLVNGKILAIWDTFALYEKEDGIWIADWWDELLIKK